MNVIFAFLATAGRAAGNVARSVGVAAARAGKAAWRVAGPTVKAVAKATGKAALKGARYGGEKFVDAIRPRPMTFDHGAYGRFPAVRSMRRNEVVLCCPRCGCDDLELTGSKHPILECQNRNCNIEFEPEEAAVAA